VAALKKEELLDQAESAVDFALKRGAEEAEAFTYQGSATNVVIERGQIAKGSRIIDRGVGIRVIINKTLGFSYTNVLENKAAIEETVNKALSLAKAGKPDENWHSLPSKKTLPPVENTFDNKIVQLSSEDLIKIASVMLNAAQKVSNKVFPIEGGVGAAYLSKAIANSNGISVFDHGTIMECSLATIAQESGEVTPVCFEFNSERSYSLNPEWVGAEAARLALSALKAKRTETKTTSIIFTQIALQELLHFTLVNAVNADSVQRDQSALKGKIGEEVASDIVSIYDDGMLSGGLRTWKFDDEGVSRRKTPIIEKGVLTNFIYDNYTAKKEGKESTGNAARAGYLSTPSAEATNFHIKSGNKSHEQLLRDVDDGLLVYYLQGAHSSNPVSGEFSVVAAPAWKIEKGKLAYAVRGAMLAGNIFDVLKNISELANNERKTGELVAPWVRIENVKVIGK